MKPAVVAVLLALTILASGEHSRAAGHAARPVGGARSGLWAMGYYPAWQHTMSLADIPFNSITHAVYFAVVPAHRAGTGTFDGTVGNPGTLADPSELIPQSAAFVTAAHRAGVKALLGVGGDAEVDAALGFQQAVQSPATLASLVRNIVSAMARGGYDGVDINWEGLEFPGDVRNFQTFIRQLRAALDRLSPPTHYLLTYPAGPVADHGYDTQYARALLPIQDALDQINLQTYSMAGAYPGWVTWHNSPLYAGSCTFPHSEKHPPAVDSTVQTYIAAGISRRKLGIGLQLAGLDWVGGHGTGTGGATRPCQSWDYTNHDQGAPTVYALPVAAVIKQYTAADGYAEHFDDATLTPWLSKHTPHAGGDHFVSFENARSIRAKGHYIKAEGLGGAIIFELSGDYLPHQRHGDAQHPLMTAVRQFILH